MVIHVPRLSVPAVVFSLLMVAGCQSKKLTQPPQTQTAGLRIDVLKADASQRKQRIDVRVRIWNDHDQRVHFDLGDVRLQFKGREVSPSPNLTKDSNPDVQAKSNRQFDWSFECGDVIGEGTYPILIRNLKKGGAPLGELAEFRINIAP